MLFFNQLENIGISREDLQLKAIPDVVRIEKMLLAESRLDTTLQKHTIYTITEILTKCRDELQLVAYDEGLYNILANKPTTYYTFYAKMNSPDNCYKMADFLNRYFKDTLMEFINAAVNDDNWIGLYILLKYKNIVPPECYELFIRKLEAKITMLLAYLENKPNYWELETKSALLIDPDFFTILGNAGTTKFTPQVTKLLQLLNTYNHYDNAVFFDNIFKAMLKFNPNDYHLHRAIHRNITEDDCKRSYMGLFTFLFLVFLFVVTILIFASHR